MSLVAGSYERFIWGYRLKSPKHPSSLTPITLTPLFSFPSHLSTIKSVAVCGSAAVSGGSDDTIKIYDLSSAAEIGSFHHSSSITSLSFYSPKQSSFPRNLIAGDDGGDVMIYDADPFVHLKTVNVHKKGVNSLAVHPSGRLALTVGRDEGLAMVNLVRGRRSFWCKLSKEASLVEFDYGGGSERFYMVVEEKVSVHDSEDARLVCEMNGQKKVLCAAPGNNGILFTGGEDRNITAWDTTSGKVAYIIEDAHAARLKGIVVMSKNVDESGENDPYIVASASSDGMIRVWDVRMVGGEGSPNPLTEANTKSRLTCLAGSSIKSSLKRPRLENVSDENQEPVES